MKANDLRIGRTEAEADAAAIARDTRPHSDGESIGTDACPLGGEEVAELVDKNQEAEAEKNEDETREGAHPRILRMDHRLCAGAGIGVGGEDFRER